MFTSVILFELTFVCSALYGSKFTLRYSAMSISLQPQWTVACQAPLFMGFPRQEYGVGCYFLLQGIFPIQGSIPCLLYLLHWQVDSSPLVPPGKPHLSQFMCIWLSTCPSTICWKYSFFCWIAFVALLKISCPYICGSISRILILFLWYTFLPSSQYHSALMTTDLSFEIR